MTEIMIPNISIKQSNVFIGSTMSNEQFGELISRFLLCYEMDGKSPLTIDGHRRKLKEFLNFLCVDNIHQITPDVIRRFLGNMRVKKNLQAATVQRYLISLKAFWHWFIDEGYVSENPTLTIKLGRVQNKIVTGLNEGQIRLVFDNLQDVTVIDNRNKAIIMIMLDTGLRVSECVNLQIKDIDMDLGIVTVIGKNQKQRFARIGSVAMEALQRYLAIRNSNSPWIWINRQDTRLTATGIQQMMKKLGRKIGIRLFPHLLRHTFTISFLRNGANIFECQYVLGHNSPEMTRRYCQALNFEDVYKKHKLASPVDNIFKK